MNGEQEADMLAYAHRAYVAGTIEADELERAVEHILRGGLGCKEFPYLPMFLAFQTETILR